MNQINFMTDIGIPDVLKNIPWWGNVAVLLWWGFGVLVIVRSYSSSGIGSAIFNGLFFVITLGAFGPLTSVFSGFAKKHIKDILKPFSR